MLAAGDLGKDAAEAPVQVDLGGHHIAENGAAILDHRGRGLIATGLDGEDTGRTD